MKRVAASLPTREVPRELVAKLFGGNHELRERIRNHSRELADLVTGSKLITFKIGKGDRRFAVQARNPDGSDLSVSMQRLIAVEHGAPADGLVL